MRRRTLLLACLLSGRSVAANPTPVRVTDVAGGLAYLNKGSRAGVRVGAPVLINGAKAKVLAVTATTAVVSGLARVAPGAEGVVEVTPSAAAEARLPAPRAAAAWFAQWPALTPPAAAQTVAKHVPLGSPEARAGRLWVEGHAQGNLDADGAGLVAAARVQGLLPVAEVTAQPLVLGVDAALRFFAQGSSGSRTPLRIHAAWARLGAASASMAELGRLPWAGLDAGRLDGARLRLTRTRGLASWELGAHAGVLPDPLDQGLDTRAVRAGVQAAWQDDGHVLRPRAEVAVGVTTWRGTLDEPRATLAAEVAPGAWRIWGWGSVQAFAPANAFAASRLSLDGAGLGATLRRGAWRGGAELTLVRPTRTRRMLESLGPSWACVETVRPDGEGQRCAAGAYQLDASGYLGWTAGRFALTGTAGRLQQHGLSTEASSYALADGAVRVVDWLSAEVGVVGRRGGGLDWLGADARLVVRPGDWPQLELGYRPELLAYAAASSAFLQHNWRARVLAQRDRWLLSTEIASSLGEDRRVITLFATLGWRVL